ncbi:MAG: nucleotide exchange factor GrpE [Bacteroidota bacterium]
MDEKELHQSQQSPTQTPPVGDAPGASDELTAKVAELEKQVEQYKDLLLRKAAEFENYKRRAENEAVTIVQFANEELISSILPILDDLERSLKLGKEKKEGESFYHGIELIYQKMMKALASQGVSPLETVGKEFSVDYHDALMQLPRSDVPYHTILEEVEKGYTLHNKVIRHAKVVVSSQAPSEPSDDSANTKNKSETS